MTIPVRVERMVRVQDERGICMPSFASDTRPVLDTNAAEHVISAAQIDTAGQFPGAVDGTDASWDTKG